MATYGCENTLGVENKGGGRFQVLSSGTGDD